MSCVIILFRFTFREHLRAVTLFSNCDLMRCSSADIDWTHFTWIFSFCHTAYALFNAALQQNFPQCKITIILLCVFAHIFPTPPSSILTSITHLLYILGSTIWHGLQSKSQIAGLGWSSGCYCWLINLQSFSSLFFPLKITLVTLTIYSTIYSRLPYVAD